MLVGRYYNLGWSRKQNGCPIEYITLLTLISLTKRGLQHLWRLIYGLLTMAMLVGSLMGVKDPGKVRNWQMPKSQIIHFLIRRLIPQQLSHGSRYCYTNNTNDLRLLLSRAFWVKKKRIDRRTVSSSMYKRPFIQDCSKHVNYCHYKWLHVTLKICACMYVKKTVQTSNEQVFNKNRVIRTVT